MSRGTRGYAHRIDVAAQAGCVWEALTASQTLCRWCSPKAQISPREGGLFRASVDRITELEAHIDVLRPLRRMRLIYLPCAALPQGSSTLVDDFMLDASGERTILRLLGSGFPLDPAWDPLYLRLRLGWERAMARLKLLLERSAGEAT